MGARLEDYERADPYKSFLHVDQFESPQQLADYLHILDKDDNKYNEYFQVKKLLTLCDIKILSQNGSYNVNSFNYTHIER